MCFYIPQLLGGEEVYHYHTKLMMKEPRTGGAHLWHQDYGFVPPPPLGSLSGVRILSEIPMPDW